MSDLTVQQAMFVLTEAIKEESGWAYSWHANIAMTCYDAIRESADNIPHEQAHLIGNDAASRFMKLCFDAETSLDMLIEAEKES